MMPTTLVFVIFASLLINGPSRCFHVGAEPEFGAHVILEPAPVSLLSAARDTTGHPSAGNQHGQMPNMAAHDNQPMRRWMLMDDGLLTVMLNHQGGPRGVTEARAPNWWMGMASHPLAGGSFTGQAMLSLDPLLVSKCGYAELFQVGETCNGQPLVDRQHPHDFVGQLAAGWRVPLNERTALAVAGGPVGEPALGPVAFMHRPSAGANPTAPLTHHTFDSTHISMGVVTAALERAPFAVETSLFNGREPNENRWNFMDHGAWDSWSARFWYLPSQEWQIQASTGHLVSPEALEPGNIQRTTVSVSWFRERQAGFTAVTGGYGRNDKTHDTLNGLFVEAAHESGANQLYARFETLQVETSVLQSGLHSEFDYAVPRQDVVAATGGIARTLARIRGFEARAGADVTMYRVPPLLVASHGSRPVSFHVYLQVRPPASMGRMWNMTMTNLLTRHHSMAMEMGER